MKNKSASKTSFDIQKSPTDILDWVNKAILTLSICLQYRGETMQKQIIAKSQDILNPLPTLCISVFAATLAAFFLVIALGINAFDPFNILGRSSQVSSMIISSSRNIYSGIVEPTKLFNSDTRSLLLACGLSVAITLVLFAVFIIARLITVGKNKKFKEYMSSYVYEGCGAFLTNLMVMILIIGLIVITDPYLPKVFTYDFKEILAPTIFISISILSGLVAFLKVRSDSEKFWVVIISLITSSISILSVMAVFELNRTLKEPFIEARVSKICGVDDEKGCLVNFKLRNLEAFEAVDKMIATVRFLDIDNSPNITQDLDFKLRVVSDKVKPLLMREDENIYIQLTPTESGCRNYANTKIKNSNLLIGDISFNLSGFALRNQQEYADFYSVKGRVTGWTGLLTRSLEVFCQGKISKYN